MAKVNKKKIALGVGLGLAAAAAGAGYYLYGSKHASANRKKVATWAHDLEADAIKAAKKLKKLDQKAYAAIVDEAKQAYGSMTSVSARDLDRVAGELKRNWKNVEREVSRSVKKNGGAARKAAKKVVKAVKKAAAKKPAKKAAKKRVTKKRKA